jgi:hypothetical protein
MVGLVKERVKNKTAPEYLLKEIAFLALVDMYTPPEQKEHWIPKWEELVKDLDAYPEILKWKEETEDLIF